MNKNLNLACLIFKSLNNGSNLASLTLVRHGIISRTFGSTSWCGSMINKNVPRPFMLLSARNDTKHHHIHRILWRSYRPSMREKNKSTAMTMTAVVVIVLGLSYAAVPLYRIYCQKTGTGMQAVAKVDELNEKVATMKKVEDRKIRVIFEAEKSSRLAWNFRPSQPSVVCSPGETVLAFYTAKNVLDRPVNGIATYTILPYEAGKYFNKIQCFCFEEQQLNANEEVDLPVFFFIDPEFSRDPYLFDVNDIVLSYNFFETKEGFKLPMPAGFKAHFPASEQSKSNANIVPNQKIAVGQ